MKRYLLFALACIACAQTNSSWEVGSMAMPTSPTNICTATSGTPPNCNSNSILHVKDMSFVNTNTSGSINLLVVDYQGNTLFAAPIAGVSGGSTYSIHFNGKPAYGGVIWSASGSGVTAWIAGY